MSERLAPRLLAHPLLLALGLAIALGGCRARSARPTLHTREDARTNRSAPSYAPATLRDLYLEREETPLVMMRFQLPGAQMTLLAAPRLANDWLALLVEARGGRRLRRCAELRGTSGDQYFTTPLDAIDVSGRRARYQIPLAALYTLASEETATLSFCDRQFTLSAHDMTVLRQYTLLTVLRRAEVVHEPPALDLRWPSEQSPEAPTARPGIAVGFDRERGARFVRLSMRQTYGRSVVLTSTEDVTDEIALTIRGVPAGQATCEEASLEVGPTLIRLRRQALAPSGRDVEHRLSFDALLRLGLVDRVSLNTCGQTIPLGTQDDIRRFVLRALALRTAARRGEALPPLELPPGQRTRESPGSLPRAPAPDATPSPTPPAPPPTLQTI